MWDNIIQLEHAVLIRLYEYCSSACLILLIRMHW